MKSTTTLVNLNTFLKYLCALTLASFCVSANAAFLDTGALKVELISIWTGSGDILLQTSPRPNISGLTCSNDHWLVLDKDLISYDATLAMLLSAQATQNSITVSAEDNDGSEFCKLRRVVNYAN